MKLGLYLAFLLLISCASELPPSPPNPGRLSNSITGNFVVGQAPSWAAVASGIQVNPFPVRKGQTAVITVDGFDIVHNKGYYYTAKTGVWKEFSLDGAVQESWVLGPARGVLAISPDFDAGKAYLIVYACNRKAAEWACNGRQWMLEEFTVVDDATLALPAAPIPPVAVSPNAAPASASNSAVAPASSAPSNTANPSAGAPSSTSNTAASASASTSSTAPSSGPSSLPAKLAIEEMVIKSEIPPFVLLGTLAVPDNFGPVNVMRYDAKYGGPAEVLVYVFDFNNRAELDKALQDQLASVLQNGVRNEGQQKIVVFGDERAHTIAFWTNGKRLVYIDTFSPDGSKVIIDKYLEKYVSDLK